MKSLVLVALFATFTLTACVVSSGSPGYGGVTVSPLPAVVVLDADSYYYQDGYYYYYQNNDWRYSKSRSGPWTELPRSHWPKEIKHRGRDDDQDRGGHDGRGRDDDGDRDRHDDHGGDYRHDYDRR
ncbi:MAG: hypothetical protein EG824_07940 [Deltaproteobacteria bacterium]|nr:hypothetical protein [Deltaproteobacteria bacterium]